MIAITDISMFPDLEVDSSLVIPNAGQINELIHATDFINAPITTAVKNLFVDISNFYYNLVFPGFNLVFENALTEVFKLAGFKKGVNSPIIFIPNPNALGDITQTIIDKLVQFKSFKEKAKNAFSNNSWAKKANDIRAMHNSGLNKIYYIGVYNSTKEDENNLLNIRNENTGRFVEIDALPSMPLVKIYNYSDAQIGLRLKMEYKKTRNSNDTGQIYRYFLDYFPKEDANNPVLHTIAPGSSWNVDFESKFRGGKLTIEYLAANESWANDTVKKFALFLRAVNPSSEQVKSYLELTHGSSHSYISRFWFLRRLIRHESASHRDDRLHNFFPKGEKYLYNNNMRGLPLFGPPRGYGLGQIDNYGKLSKSQAMTAGVDLDILAPGASKEYQTAIDVHNRTIDRNGWIVASDQTVWNWKANTDALIAVLISKIQTVLNKINAIRIAIKNWNSLHPNDKVVIPEDVAYNYITYSWVRSSIPEFNTSQINELFTEDQISTAEVKSFFDAMLLKSYNGLGNKDFGQFHFLHLSFSANSKPILTVKESAGYYDDGEPKYNFYVRSVSNTNE